MKKTSMALIGFAMSLQFGAPHANAEKSTNQNQAPSKTSKSIVLEDKKIVMCQDNTMSFLDKSGSIISSQKLGPKNALGVTGSNPYNIFINNKILRAAYPNQSNSDISFNGAVFDRDTLDKDVVGVVFKKISSDGTTEILHLTRKGNAEYIIFASTVFDAKSPRIMQMMAVCN